MPDDAGPLMLFARELLPELPECPAAKLAAEAAAAARLVDRLRHDAELRGRFNEDDNSVSADDIRHTLLERIGDLERMATHVQATSRKGALFQILVARARTGEILSGLPVSAADLAEASGERSRIIRLLHSAFYAMLGNDPDRDLSRLAEWYAGEGFHETRVIDRLAAEA